MVAAATTTLCEAANSAVQGNASEERLVAAAKQVANSTAQLLLACRVQTDANSESQRKLQVFVCLFICLFTMYVLLLLFVCGSSVGVCYFACLCFCLLVC